MQHGQNILPSQNGLRDVFNYTFFGDEYDNSVANDNHVKAVGLTSLTLGGATLIALSALKHVTVNGLIAYLEACPPLDPKVPGGTRECDPALMPQPLISDTGSFLLWSAAAVCLSLAAAAGVRSLYNGYTGMHSSGPVEIQYEDKKGHIDFESSDEDHKFFNEESSLKGATHGFSQGFQGHPQQQGDNSLHTSGNNYNLV